MPFTTPIRTPSLPDDQPARMRLLREVCTHARPDLPERPHGLIRPRAPQPVRSNEVIRELEALEIA